MKSSKNDILFYLNIILTPIFLSGVFITVVLQLDKPVVRYTCIIGLTCSLILFLLFQKRVLKWLREKGIIWVLIIVFGVILRLLGLIFDEGDNNGIPPPQLFNFTLEIDSKNGLSIIDSSQYIEHQIRTIMNLLDAPELSKEDSIEILRECQACFKRILNYKPLIALDFEVSLIPSNPENAFKEFSGKIELTTVFLNIWKVNWEAQRLNLTLIASPKLREFSKDTSLNKTLSEFTDPRQFRIQYPVPLQFLNLDNLKSPFSKCVERIAQDYMYNITIRYEFGIFSDTVSEKGHHPINLSRRE